MIERSLGRIPVSVLGLGTGRLASLGGGLAKPEAEKLLIAARDAGVNLIDTADTYGSGDCERLLGRLLRHHRGAFRIVTKAGYRYADFPGWLSPANQIGKKLLNKLGPNKDFSPARIVHCLDRSLDRLRTDHVEAFLLHEPPLEAVTDPELGAALRSALASGKAAQIGVSSGNPAVIAAALAMEGCTVVQTPVSPLQDSARAILETARQKGAAVMANHVFQAGKLLAAESGNPGPGNDLGALALKWNSPLPELLLRYVASLPGVTSVLTGTKNPVHLRRNALAIQEPLSAGCAVELEQAAKNFAR